MELNELSSLTTHLREKSDLDRNHIRTAIDLLLQEDVDQNEKADFLVALAGKGESSQEITDFVSYFRELARDPELGDFPTAPSIFAEPVGTRPAALTFPPSFLSFSLPRASP